MKASEFRDLSLDEQRILARAECPFCGRRELYEGPHGGLAVNVYCGGCGAGFNLGPVFDYLEPAEDRRSVGFFPAQLIAEPRPARS